MHPMIITMTAAKAKISNAFVYPAETVIYRKPSTITWYGFIWGCDCESVLGKWSVLPTNPNAVSGAVIWTASSPYSIILLDDMRWHVMGAVDKTGKRCEVAWTIGSSEDESNAFLSFAGFGSLTLKGKRSDGFTEIYCTSYMSSVSGSVSGWMPAPTYCSKGRAATCTFCGIVDAGSDASCEMAEAWNFCPCTEVGDSTFTAVSGTWMLKYNASLSKKLASNTNASSILDVYSKFPSSVRSQIEKKIKAVRDSAEDDDDDYEEDDDDLFDGDED